MITGYHVIFGAYGFWLPNDPRGSWSDFVGSWELSYFGRATTTADRGSRASREHDCAARWEAKATLRYPPLQFTGLQARAIGRGFAKYFSQSPTPVWACSILPDHVHLVIGRPTMKVERLVIQLKGAATERLVREGVHPQARFQKGDGRVPKCFARGEWKVFLDPDDVSRAIRYVELNPTKEEKPEQRWSFVTTYAEGDARAPLARRG